ncbi:MAG TPA: hypothetical protein VGO34_12205 [Alphaproteobacteria bacterium]|jgi:hypothetical protein
MLSSTSNSEPKRRRLWPVLAWAAAILASYACLVQFFVPAVRVELYPSSEFNHILSEGFLTSPTAAPIAVAGSSLAQHLPASVLRPFAVNVALAGGGPLTGLELAALARAAPRLVLVETNFVERGPDEKILERASDYPWNVLRQHVKAAQYAYRPTNLLYAALRYMREKPAPAELVMLPKDMIEKLIQKSRADLSQPAPADLLKERLDQMDAEIAHLNERGICVAFFEMPVDAALEATVRLVDNREAMQRRFPSARFPWLAVQLPTPARTSDGLHLAIPDATLVAEQLLAQAKALVAASQCGPVALRAEADR